jgi:hypothetical protein
MMAVISMGNKLCIAKGKVKSKVKSKVSAWKNVDVQAASCCHRLYGTPPAPEDIIGARRDMARARRRLPRGMGD